MDEVRILLDKCYELWDLYQIGNPYSDKEYGYLNDEIEDVEVGYFKTPFDELDSDYSERLREANFTMTKEDAINTLQHRIQNILEEINDNK